MKESFFSGPSLETSTTSNSKEKTNLFAHFQNPDQATKLENLLLDGLQISDETFKDLLEKLDNGVDINEELEAFSHEVGSLEPIQNIQKKTETKP